MNLFFSRQSTSDWIVFVLSKKPGLRCGHVLRELNAQGLKMSYQNVHKTVKALEQSGVLRNEKNRYFVSPQWIKELKRFADSVQD